MMLILHRQIDGARVLVSAHAIHLDDDDISPAWPYVETFDEIANACSAMHVLDTEEAKRRVHGAVVDAEYRCVECGNREDQHAVSSRDGRGDDVDTCTRACAHVMRSYPPNGTRAWSLIVRCVRTKGHDGEHDDGLPF